MIRTHSRKLGRYCLAVATLVVSLAKCSFGDHYNTLGLTSSASQNDIKKAWKKFVLQHHPDRNPDGDSNVFIEGSKAYDAISTPEKRREYDAERAGGHRTHFQNNFQRGDGFGRPMHFNFNFNFQRQQQRQDRMRQYSELYGLPWDTLAKLASGEERRPALLQFMDSRSFIQSQAWEQIARGLRGAGIIVGAVDRDRMHNSWDMHQISAPTLVGYCRGQVVAGPAFASGVYSLQDIERWILSWITSSDGVPQQLYGVGRGPSKVSVESLADVGTSKGVLVLYMFDAHRMDFEARALMHMVAVMRSSPGVEFSTLEIEPHRLVQSTWMTRHSVVALPAVVVFQNGKFRATKNHHSLNARHLDQMLDKFAPVTSGLFESDDGWYHYYDSLLRYSSWAVLMLSTGDPLGSMLLIFMIALLSLAAIDNLFPASETDNGRQRRGQLRDTVAQEMLSNTLRVIPDLGVANEAVPEYTQMLRAAHRNFPRPPPTLLYLRHPPRPIVLGEPNNNEIQQVNTTPADALVQHLFQAYTCRGALTNSGSTLQVAWLDLGIYSMWSDSLLAVAAKDSAKYTLICKGDSGNDNSEGNNIHFLVLFGKRRVATIKFPLIIKEEKIERDFVISVKQAIDDWLDRMWDGTLKMGKIPADAFIAMLPNAKFAREVERRATDL